MITDDGLRGAPLGQRLPKDVEDTREILPLEAARSDDRATIPIKNQPAIEPLPGNLDKIPEIDKPGLMRGCRRLGAFRRIRDTGLPRWVRMGLLVERNHLPDGGVAIAIAQRIQGHFHAIVAQQGVVVQELEDVHHRLDRYPHSDRRVRAGLRRQPAQAQRMKATLPIIDDWDLDASEFRHPTWTEAHL